MYSHLFKKFAEHLEVISDMIRPYATERCTKERFGLHSILKK
jgi:hypothetical protein